MGTGAAECVRHDEIRVNDSKHRSTKASWAVAGDLFGGVVGFTNVAPPGQARLAADGAGASRIEHPASSLGEPG
jgi:hypothetical protein